MNLTRKNLILFIVIGVLVSGIPVLTLFLSYCNTSGLALDSPMYAGCAFSYHAFIQIAVVLSALFVLPLVGPFLAREGQFIRPEVYLPIFKPPRFSH